MRLEGLVERLHLARKWVSKRFLYANTFFTMISLTRKKITMCAGMSTKVNIEMEATSINVYSYRAAKYITPQLRC